jgi:ABC-2 type transport system ATP-binding protein
MADVTALCPRVILIHHGQLLYDGGLTDLAARLAPFKVIRVGLSADRDWSEAALPIGVEVLQREDDHLELRAARSEAPAIMAQLLNTLPVIDLVVEDPPIEAVIDQIYQEGAV